MADGPEGPVRVGGDEMALDVERVVGGRVEGQKRRADPALLKPCILRSRRGVG